MVYCKVMKMHVPRHCGYCREHNLRVDRVEPLINKSELGRLRREGRKIESRFLKPSRKIIKRFKH